MSDLLSIWDDQVRLHDLRDVPPHAIAECSSYLAVKAVGERLMVISQNKPDTHPDDVRGCIEYFQRIARTHNLSIEWWAWHHDRPFELSALLVEAGFEPVPPEPLLLARTKDVVLNTAELPDGLRFRILGSVDEVMEVVGQLKKLPEADPHLAEELPVAVRDGYNQVVVVESAHSLVGCAWVIWKPGTDFAGLAGAFVNPIHRGHGIQNFLIVERSRLVIQRGGIQYLFAEVSSPYSERNLTSLGFERVTERTTYVWRLT